MKELFISIGEMWDQYIWSPIVQFDFWDALDILLLTTLLYGVYLFVKGRRAGKLAVGLFLIFAFYAISDIAGLRAMHRLLEGIAPFTIILLAIIFQPELRDALEKLGSTPMGIFTSKNENRADLAHTVSEVVEAACQIAMTEKDGALIVIERSTPLGDYVAKGHALDANVTGNLLRNIFVDRSPLHDGAVIIRNNRIAAAGSKLPLSVNEDVVKGMGTRHRAAVGITEVSDCVVVVVSEEKHIISIASNGFIKRDYYKNASDIQNETTMKSVQNALRNDLFRLLAGAAFDEDETERSPRFKLSLRFRWRSEDSIAAATSTRTPTRTPRRKPAVNEAPAEEITFDPYREDAPESIETHEAMSTAEPTPTVDDTANGTVPSDTP